MLILAGSRPAGWTAVVYARASMVAAALALAVGGPRYRRAAVTQALFPGLALLAALVHAL